MTVIAVSLALLFGMQMPARAAGSSGVHGLVRLSHGCPGPVREGDTRRCDFAGVGILVRVFRASVVSAVAADRTDRAGRFAIALPPGRYQLLAVVAKARVEPVLVRVGAASWTAVTLRYLVPPYME